MAKKANWKSNQKIFSFRQIGSLVWKRKLFWIIFFSHFLREMRWHRVSLSQTFIPHLFKLVDGILLCCWFMSQFFPLFAITNSMFSVAHSFFQFHQIVLNFWMYSIRFPWSQHHNFLNDISSLVRECTEKSVHVKERVRKVRAKTQIFTRHCHETGMQKKNRTVQRKNYIYKYILCSMFDLIVAVVVIVDVRSKVSNRRRRRCRWFYYYAQHIRFFYYYCSPLDLIHTMLLIF